METIKSGIVISNDINLILEGNNAFNFDYREKMALPSAESVDLIRLDFLKELKKIFNGDVLIIDEKELFYIMNNFVDKYKGTIPIISSDMIYVNCDEKEIFGLDCTRISGSTELISRFRPNEKDGFERNVSCICDRLKKENKKEVIFLDDVVFSGDTVKLIISLFNKYGINVVGVSCGISSRESYEYFNSALKFGLETGYIMEDEVFDEICERDFYYGIAQSGINIKAQDNLIYKAPYFLPFGDPVKRASIPEEYAKSFSTNCIIRSRALFEEIEKSCERTIYNRDLPEKIISTNLDDPVCASLSRCLTK